jgi:hypothetical protein
MKKVFYTLALGVIFSSAFSSCKKCGHCQYASGGSSDKTCQTGNTIQDLVYTSAKNSCEGAGDKWVTE